MARILGLTFLAMVIVVLAGAFWVTINMVAMYDCMIYGMLNGCPGSGH